ncbi:MAG: DUF4123 domain-containing protein [Candidatus Polarisedimenticolaceae bacterium]|nr:DUF4123 domain-containing protein [Candidatus Polarisedimenticolaceae bacterium]
MFRFYDPRVLRLYLPTCTGNEAKQFFGPIPQIIVEAENSTCLLTYNRRATGIRQQRLTLQQEERSFVTDP